jgi:acetyl esterase/lipase
MKITALILAAWIIALPADIASADAADTPLVMNIWPTMPPGDRPATQPEKLTGTMLTHVSVPTISISRPPKEKDTGATIIIFPGGGFTALSMENEGTNVVKWLNSIGVTGVLLKYRVPNREGMPRYMAGLQDAQRAIAMVRSKAGDWNLDSHRIGVIGFSAGGRMVADVTTNFDKLSYDAVDETDKTSTRPDFALAIYPGGIVEKPNVDKVVADVHPTKETPPTFIAIATNDRNGSENAVYYYLALKNAGVNAELHIYSDGAHGFGMVPSTEPHGSWTTRAVDWMNYHKFLTPAAPVKSSGG